jgi:hypothetical protein
MEFTEVQTEQQRLSELISFVAPLKSSPLVKQVEAFKQQSEIPLPSNLRQQFVLIGGLSINGHGTDIEIP